jgi:NADPH:quinone reductase-like Zn-dependent oxidoreductase
MVLGIGADHLFDYKKENFTQSDEEFDLIIDNVVNHPIADLRKVMKPNGRIVMVGGPKGDWIGPMLPVLKAKIVDPFVSQELKTFVARLQSSDLAQIAQWVEEGKVRSVIDRRFSLAQIEDAIAYSETGRARGKIIVTAQ